MAFALVNVALLLCACTKVSIIPLGSTSEGRPQFEVRCNSRATDDGSCHEQARHACGSDYETLDVSYTGLRLDSWNGSISSAPGDRVLLISCNRRSRVNVPAPAGTSFM